MDSGSPPNSTICPMRGSKPIARPCAAHSSISLLLPMPASPRTRMTRPDCADRQFSSRPASWRSSISRPMKGRAGDASNPRRNDSTRHMGGEFSMPAMVTPGSNSARRRSPTASRTSPVTRISPAAAPSMTRAAMLTGPPVRVVPPLSRLASTRPPATPIWLSSRRPAAFCIFGTLSRIAMEARMARSASLPWATGTPKTAISREPM